MSGFQYPVALGRVLNTAVNANTNIFSTALTPTKLGDSGESTFRVTISVDTAVKVNVFIDGVNIGTINDDGATLTPNTLNTFVFGARNVDTINFQLSGNATVNVLYVSEVTGMVA